MAMQKELVNTPERLAKVQSTTAHSWAAINKGKQRSRCSQQAQQQASRSPSRPRVDTSEATAAVDAAASAEDVLEELVEAAVASPAAEGQDEMPDAVPLSGLTKEPTVHFSIPDAIEDNNSAEVSLGLCNISFHSSELLFAYASKQQARYITDTSEQVCLSHSASAASSSLGFSVGFVIPCKSQAGLVHVHGYLHTLLLAIAVLSTTFTFGVECTTITSGTL